MTRRTLLAASACALLTQAVPGGQAPASSQERPTFRAEARAIEVDAVVADRNDQFVRGLAKEDFEIFEDGQPQTISAFTLVDLPIDTPGPQSKPQKERGPAVEPDVVTNAAEGRIYVMLLDSPGLRVHETAYVKMHEMFRHSQRAARRFVDEALGPSDLMAVVHVQASRNDAQSFTRNKSLLRASIDRMTPDMTTPEVRSGEPPYCDVEKLRNTYETLQTVSERLGALTGRRKAILWVNGRIPFDPSDPGECTGTGSQPGLGAAQASSLAFMYRDAMRAATRNNVAIYPIDAVGLTADPTGGVGEPVRLRLLRMAALRAVAEDTGGEAVVNTNNFSPAFERVVRANSSYYLLGYHPAVDHRDGKLHTIDVRVRRPGLTVRTRKGYTAPGPEAPIQTRLLPGVSAEAGAALVNALPANGLGLEVFLAPFKGTEKNGSVVLGAGLRGLSREAGADSRVEISYMAIDSQGASRVAPPKLIARAPSGAATSVAVPFVDRLSLPPGRHELRVAVHQSGGATGSVVAYVDVPDYSRVPLALSGLVLASTGAAQSPLLSDAKLRGILSADPTTDRRFARRDTLTAYVEVYTEARTRVEDVAVAATLATAKGAKVRSEAVTLTAEEPGRAGVLVRFSLADLAPGDYVLTMEAKAGRRTATRQVGFGVTE